MTKFERNLDAHQQQAVELDSETGCLTPFGGGDTSISLDPNACAVLYGFLTVNSDVVTRATNAPYTVYDDSARQLFYEAVNTLYGGVFPEYVIADATDEEQFVVLVNDWTGETALTIDIASVCDYFQSGQPNRSTANLAGHSGEPRMLSDLAQEAFNWFKTVNRTELEQVLDRRGMKIDPRGD